MHPALFSSCRMKCIFCMPPSVCRAIKTALPRRALAGRLRTRKPAAQSRLIGCSPRRMSMRELAAAAVPADRCKALYATGYAGYVEPRGGWLPYSV